MGVGNEIRDSVGVDGPGLVVVVLVPEPVEEDCRRVRIAALKVG